MKKNQGFTLIEVAIVMLIGGLLLGMAASLLLNYTKRVQIATTERRIEAIDEALQLFLNLNGRYPCPAPIAAAIDDAGGAFGFEEFNAGAGVCTGPATGTAGRGGRQVRIGAVPVRTLNLPDDFVADAWSGRFTYAVTDALAGDGTYNRDEGGIFVIDSNNVQMTPTPGTAHYVLISHGSNNAGATPIGGGGATPCLAGSLEEENCDDNATFRNTMLAGTGNLASFYDDMVSFRATTAFGEQVPEGAVIAFNLSACPPGWTEFAPAGGRYVIGMATPSYPLGATGGSETAAISEPETPYMTSPNAVDLAFLATLDPGTDQVVVNVGVGATGHENRPPYIALLYCEKT